MKRLFTGILLLVCVASAARSGRSHGYVDLGLSVRWATCNLGASSPEKAGDYYAWGETGVKDSCTVWNYRWCEGFYWNERFTKYGSVDGKRVLEASDDAARAAWGGKWRTSIFLPAAGDKLGTTVRSSGIRGYYMSATLIEGHDHGACNLLFEKGKNDWMYCYRYYGQCVRPVQSE